MKLSRIKALCKARCMVELYDRRDGKQFLSDGCGIWPVDEKLVLSEGVVRAVFEVAQKKWESDWHFQHIRFGEDDDAEACGLPECLLKDFWSPGTEPEFLPMKERALMVGAEMRLFAEATGKGRHIWVSTAQFAACPENVRMFALRSAPDGTLVLAVYDDVFVGGLVRVLDTAHQREMANMLVELGGKEVF